LDYVKLDRPFVARTFSDRVNSGMMSAMLNMISSMGLTAIAEMVETEAAADALRKLGCEFGQGYFFSEPVQAEVALQYLRGEPFVLRSRATTSIVEAPSAAGASVSGTISALASSVPRGRLADAGDSGGRRARAGAGVGVGAGSERRSGSAMALLRVHGTSEPI
jgi:hypothetical protein